MGSYELEYSGKSEKGCQCSTAVGFLLVLLAVAIAVGVGLIVHFAEKDGRDVTCNVNLATPTADQAVAGCVALAKGKHRDVCNACTDKPDGETTAPPVTTKEPEVTTAVTTAPPLTYPIRLTGTQIPSAYTVKLKPDFYSANQSEFSLYGQSSVLFTCYEDSDDVIMHLKDLNLAENSIIVREENGSEDLFDSYSLYDPSELIIIKTKSTLKKGHNYTVEFTEYSAPLRIDFNGVYLGSFKRNGETVYHISSSFEPTFARMAFPCFDEPALKATFDITIVRKDGVVAISNMPLSETTTDSDGWKHDMFERSPVMSTYLVVFIIGDFTSTSVQYKNRFPITLWSRDELKAYRNYTLDIGPVIMEYYEDFFGVEYPLPKQGCDAVVPVAANENWGSFIYLEQFSLYHEDVTSARNKPGISILRSGGDVYISIFRPGGDVNVSIFRPGVDVYIGCDAVVPVAANENWGSFIYLEQFSLYHEDVTSARNRPGISILRSDQVAMLSFPSWAMENWGAFIYLEQFSLYQEGVTSARNKLDITEVVGHEMSHNWFGNLVSPEWWDDIWLNEAFATYMAYDAADHIAPEWKPFEVFMTNVYKDAIPIDEKIGSHPVYVEGLEKTADIYAVFDPITYWKGGHLVRMLAELVGTETFSKGMKLYMARHAYDNARHQDLWDALQTEADIAGSNVPNLPAMISTWIYQMGFPTVHVNFTESGKLILTQSRYLKDKSATDPGIYTSRYGYKWDVPFTFTTNTEKNFDLPGEVVLMNHTHDSVAVNSGRIPSPAADNWVIGNLQALVFMQVNYDQRNWNAIVKQLKTDHTVIHSFNRFQLIKDSWNLAKSDELGFETALRVVEYMPQEREYGPWFVLAREWRYIGQMLQDHPLYYKFYNYVQNTIRPAYVDIFSKSTSDPNMPISERMVMAEIMDIACEYGVQECIDDVTSLLAAWMKDPQNKPSGITSDLAGVIYNNAVRHGGAAEWQFMLDVYRNSSLQTETQRALTAMACTRHTWLLAKFTSLLLDSDVIDSPDVDEAFNLMAQYGSNPMLLWDWMRENYDAFIETQFLQYTATSINFLAKALNSKWRLQELEAFVEEKEISTNPFILDAMATVQANIKWMDQSLPTLQTWLQNNGY